MKRLYGVLLNVSVFALLPAVAGAAGTYYNSSLYQNSRYGNSGGYYNRYNSSRGYPVRTDEQVAASNNKQSTSRKSTSSAKQGFAFDMGLSHEMANWRFDMNNAGSKLHYDNLSWNVISGQGVYYFGGNTPMQIKAGAKYGRQFDETTMIDDDISQGGYVVTGWDDGSGSILGYQTGHALSIGKSSDGSQIGFNASFGFTNAFSMGGVKITPSVGYRYLKYKLSTKQNYGVAIDIFESSSVINCIEVQDGEVQCNPFLSFAGADGTVVGIAGFSHDENNNLYIDEDGNFIITVPADAVYLDFGGTYYYEQYGTSHEYETTWAGPYFALDMEYEINKNNSVNAGFEFGLPIYDTKGNQPYRYDWAHPTSVEDKGSLGDAIHLGVNADWKTQISDSVSFSLGMTYDYYKVSNADATTNLNATYYQSVLNAYINDYNDGKLNADGIAYMQELESLKANGWKQEDKKEINSVYKSMGIRAGLSVKF